MRWSLAQTDVIGSCPCSEKYGTSGQQEVNWLTTQLEVQNTSKFVSWSKKCCNSPLTFTWFVNNYPQTSNPNVQIACTTDVEQISWLSRLKWCGWQRIYWVRKLCYFCVFCHTSVFRKSCKSLHVIHFCQRSFTVNQITFQTFLNLSQATVKALISNSHWTDVFRIDCLPLSSTLVQCGCR